jgi:hypothetical protein
VKKSQKSISRSQTTLNFRNHHPVNNNHMEMLHFRSFIHTDQRYEIADGPSITLDYIDVTMTVNIDEELHDQIRAVIRKSLPSTIHIKVLIPSKDVNIQSSKSEFYQFLFFRFFKIYNLIHPKIIIFIIKFSTP